MERAPNGLHTKCTVYFPTGLFCPKILPIKISITITNYNIINYAHTVTLYASQNPMGAKRHGNLMQLHRIFKAFFIYLKGKIKAPEGLFFHQQPSDCTILTTC